MSVRSEIESRINTWAKAQVPPIPVSFENVSFTKPTSGPYLEVFLLGETRLNRNVAADGIRSYGIFQINCYAPTNKGMGEVEALCNNMVALFPVLPKTGTVSIEAPLSWSGSDIIDGYVCVPVRGNYRVET
jgi:hypothetical protein